MSHPEALVLPQASLHVPPAPRHHHRARKPGIFPLFAGVLENCLIVYLDDLIVVSKDLDSHLQKLSLVFQKLAKADLKVSLQNVNSLNHALSLLDMSLKELAFTLLILKSLL